MAKTKTNANVDTNVDDLLNDTGSAENGSTDNGTTTENAENSSEGTTAATETEEEKKARIQKQLDDIEAQKKALKAELKGEKVKAEKTLKGHMVTFKNKNGEQITGLGTLYYVTRMGGKLYYKEASQVAILPEGWKEGDPLPAIPGELPEAKA